MNNKDSQIIRHILKYCNKIECTVSRFGADAAVFTADPDYRDSIAMNLLQIGELAGKLSPEYIRSSSQNWRAIKNMRNMFAHDYGSMDIDRIWDTAILDIPELKNYCREELQSKGESLPLIDEL